MKIDIEKIASIATKLIEIGNILRDTVSTLDKPIDEIMDLSNVSVPGPGVKICVDMPNKTITWLVLSMHDLQVSTTTATISKVCVDERLDILLCNNLLCYRIRIVPGASEKLIDVYASYRNAVANYDIVMQGLDAILEKAREYSDRVSKMVEDVKAALAMLKMIFHS